ncbi:MAG: hypothetical protein FIB08_12235 [Candidatus Methanoperedens sp.]|nr:hypothetical protein [Candidatus Methanoperedens sp.]
MKFKNVFKNDDAVSISIGFILMFAVTVLVFSALIISFYSLSRDTEKSAMQESFKIMGNGVAIKLTAVDTMINSTNFYEGTVNALEYEFVLPASIAGKSYTMNITGAPSRIIMEADNGAKITIPFNISTNFTPRKIYSGAENYMFYYNKTSSSIEIVEKS